MDEPGTSVAEKRCRVLSFRGQYITVFFGLLQEVLVTIEDLLAFNVVG